MDFWSNSNPNKHHQIVEPQPKRISTPAGQRLSVILENGDAAKHTRDSHRASVRKSGLAATLGEVPRESSEEQSHGSSGYSYSVWSENEKFQALRNHKQIAKRGGWKRLAIIAAIVIALIIALAVGLAVGLKKKSSSSNNDSNNQSPAAAEASKTAASDTPNPTATNTVAPSSLPSNFPAGSYSMLTFLDTVQTNCTQNPSTWTCYPYTDYNTDASKALATFNWIISGSKGKYQISSTQNPFSISFKNTDLELLDEGESTERYRFQLSQTKTVSPSSSLSDDNAAVECDFEGTSLQAYLYTKMARTYPDTSKGEPEGGATYPQWPFAVRVEQAVGGGQGIPACYKLNNGQHGDQITKGLDAQDPTGLCSCLYKNWRTPAP